MIRAVKKFLPWILIAIVAISLFTLTLLHIAGYPPMIITPNVTIIRCFLFGVYDDWIWIIICILILAVLFISAISVKRNHVILPILSFIIFFCDLVYVSWIFIIDLITDDLINDLAIISGLTDVLVIAMLVVYFSYCYKVKNQNIQVSFEQ